MKKAIETITKITGNVVLFSGLIFAITKALQTLSTELQKVIEPSKDTPNEQ